MKTGSSFDGPLHRPDTAEERFPEPEDISTETSKTEKQRENRLTKAGQNIQTVGQPQKMEHAEWEYQKEKKGTGAICETIMAENFPKLVSDAKPQIQEVQRTPSRTNDPKTTRRHISFKLQKIKYENPKRSQKNKTKQKNTLLTEDKR